VLPEDSPGGYHGRTVEYTILTAGAVDGRFAEAATPWFFLEARLDYQPAGAPDGVILQVEGLPVASAARTANQRSVAELLDALAEHKASALFDAVYRVSGAEQALTALDRLSGEVYTAFPVASAAVIERFARAVLEGMEHPEAEEGRRGWVTAYGTSGKLKGGSEHPGADVKVAGGAAGMHVLAGGNGRVGITAGFAHSQVDMGERNSSMTGDGYQLGVYGRYDLGTLRMTGLFVHSRTRYDAQRRVSLGVGADRFDRTAQGKFDGTQMLASLRAEGLNRAEGATVVQPVLGLSWLRTSRNGFGEEGADDANLRV